MMSSSLSKSLKYLPVHITLWVLVWLFYVYFFSYSAENKEFVMWFSSSLLPITMAATYIFAYFLIPKYLIAKKYVSFVLYSCATIICSVYAVLLLTFIILMVVSNFEINQMPLLTRNFIFVFILVYLVVAVVSFIRLLQYQYVINAKNSMLEKKLLEGQLQLKQKELQYLKQQIHPHFLFNTLNTIYGFSLKESKETPELILKLSNLLDYILNQIDKPQVPVSEEINYIDSYIGLEQIRFRDTLRIKFVKNIKTNVQVPPMILMPFIENAFKHGGLVEGLLPIEMSINATNKELVFNVKNPVRNSGEHENHGLGILNSKKRLETLYPDSHNLSFDEVDGHFKLELRIFYK